MSRVMQFHVKKRIKMSPREAVIRNSSYDDNSNNDKRLQEESQLTMKVLLRHQNKTSMDWQHSTNKSNGSIDDDKDD